MDESYRFAKIFVGARAGCNVFGAEAVAHAVTDLATNSYMYHPFQHPTLSFNSNSKRLSSQSRAP
jgi:hypothetical protein